MGWKPGKFLKKIGKGLKKAVKSIGKGIKKVVGKIGAAIGKLGIIGQIGMMFLMPYAMAGLSSFFGTVGTKIATWSAKLMGPGAGAVSKGFGKFLGAVHKAGSMAVNAYQTVTQAIGNGVDRVGNLFKGEGFTLSADRTSVFGATKPVTTAPIAPDAIKVDAALPDASSVFEPGTTNLKGPQSLAERVSGQSIDASSVFDTGTTNLKGPQSLADRVIADSSLLAPKVPIFEAGATSQTFGEYIKALPGEIAGGVKDAFADPGQLAKETIESGLTSGAVSGISNRVASSIMGDPPVQRVQQLTDGVALASYLQNDPSGRYNEVNLALNQQGSSWGAGNAVHYNYTQANLSDGSDDYNRTMQQIKPVYA